MALELPVQHTYAVFEKTGGDFRELAGNYQFPQIEGAKLAAANYIAAHPDADIYIGQIVLKVEIDPDAQ